MKVVRAVYLVVIKKEFSNRHYWRHWTWRRPKLDSNMFPLQPKLLATARKQWFRVENVRWYKAGRFGRKKYWSTGLPRFHFQSQASHLVLFFWYHFLLNRGSKTCASMFHSFFSLLESPTDKGNKVKWARAVSTKLHLTWSTIDFGLFVMKPIFVNLKTRTRFVSL